MFYCDDCAKKYEYPESFGKSNGKCELCDTVARCNDVSSSRLPNYKPTERKLDKSLPISEETLYDNGFTWEYGLDTAQVKYWTKEGFDFSIEERNNRFSLNLRRSYNPETIEEMEGINSLSWNLLNVFREMNKEPEPVETAFDFYMIGDGRKFEYNEVLKIANMIIEDKIESGELKRTK